MQDLKVVHLINESSLKLGGAQKIVHHMSNSRFETEVMDFDNGGKIPDYTIVQKLICFSKLFLRIFLKKNEIYVVHHRAFLIFSLLAPRKFLFVCHNVFPTKNFIYTLISRVKIIAVSEEVKRYLLSHNRKLFVCTIPNGIEVSSDEEKTFVSDQVLRIGFVGRLEYQKGADVLIKAYLKVCNSKNVKLTIVGDGSLSEEFREALSNKIDDGSVELLGYQVHPWRPLRHCDYIIVPSRYEGFGLVAYEAISRGHSVILSDLDVFSAMKNAGNIRFVQPGDVDDLRDCINALQKIDAKNSRFESNAPDLFDSVDTMINKYDQLFLKEFVKEVGRN